MTSHADQRPRVVVADDHPHVLAALGRLVQPSCEVVASVATGKEAIDAAGRLKPDVLIVDLMMPDLDGFEVCRIVKQDSPETAVIIITAFDDPHVRAVATQKGASAFVAKHSVASTLEETIRRLFGARAEPDRQDL